MIEIEAICLVVEKVSETPINAKFIIAIPLTDELKITVKKRQ